MIQKRRKFRCFFPRDLGLLVIFLNVVGCSAGVNENCSLVDEASEKSRIQQIVRKNMNFAGPDGSVRNQFDALSKHQTKMVYNCGANLKVVFLPPEGEGSMGFSTTVVVNGDTGELVDLSWK